MKIVKNGIEMLPVGSVYKNDYVFDYWHIKDCNGDLPESLRKAYELWEENYEIINTKGSMLGMYYLPIKCYWVGKKLIGAYIDAHGGCK